MRSTYDVTPGAAARNPLLQQQGLASIKSTLTLPYSDVCAWSSFHYWRILPQYWEDRLKRGLALGLNTIQARSTATG